MNSAALLPVTISDVPGPVVASVSRGPLGNIGTPLEVLRCLPSVSRLVVLMGSWSQGEALIAWDPLCVSDAPFDLDFEVVEPDEAAFGGGWIGVWGYGLARELEDLPLPPARPHPQPACRVGLYDRVLRFVDGQWWFEQLGGLMTQDVELSRAESFLATLGQALECSSPQSGFSLGDFKMMPSPSEHMQAVTDAVKRVAAGEVFQVNLAARLEAGFAGDPLALFCKGFEALQPAYAAYIASPEGTVCSFSPELFLRRHARNVESRPIKGTVPLSVPPANLLRSAKDQAENLMIVDLMRNDLGRVAEQSTVQVPAVNMLEKHAVWHLVSRVCAVLRDDVTDGDLLRATFPPGSVTGAPKVRAMEIINELECTGRESYTGAIGYVSPYAGLELNVAIRTIELSEGTAWMGVGGGIVHDSKPEEELAECFAKAVPVVAALGARVDEHFDPIPRVRNFAGQGAWPRSAALFETFLVLDRELVSPQLHFERLRKSVAEVHGATLGSDFEAMVRQQASLLAGRNRLRVDVDSDANHALHTSVKASPLAPSPTSMRLSTLRLPGGAGPYKWVDRPWATPDPDPRHDVLICDTDGTVLETGCGAILAVIDDQVCAPILDGRLLPSTGRERVGQLLRRCGMPLVERHLTIADLERATEVITVNALRAAVPVVDIDGRLLAPGPVVVWLQDELAGKSDTAPRPKETQGSASNARVLFIDNYDSFVYNLVQSAAACGAAVDVLRNDARSVDEIEELCQKGEFTHVVISPGPGRPEQAGVSVDLIRRIGRITPILGVCLGHQAIAVAYGAKVVQSEKSMYGKPGLIHHDGTGLLSNSPRPFVGGRYHGLVVDPKSVPESLAITSHSSSGAVMGLRHKQHPVEGVQWHPESILSPSGDLVMRKFLDRITA